MDSRALRDLRGESDFPPAPVPGDDALIGTLVAERYRVVRKLGEGAQASVYVAKHTLIKRLVALKVLSPSIAADRDLVRRFLDEGQVAGTMGHPNIVESLDMGVVEDGRPFLVLEYLEGTTVADELHRRGALDVGRAAYIGMQIASALAATHARGIVHRDLKPENVFLIDRDGRGDHAKVLDFGISKLESRKEGSARAGLVVGTPDYMAPEQVTDPATVDARADVFGLGAMLYEMLSGRLPLDAGADEDVLEVVVRRTPAPLGRICPHLPPQILAAVERAMHKDRSKRTQTIAELRAVLETFAVTSPAASVSSLPAAASLSVPSMPKLSGVQSLNEGSDSGRPSGVNPLVAAPSGRPSASLATTAENAVVSSPPASDPAIPAAAVSTVSVVASNASTPAAAANAERLSAQLAAIAAVAPPTRARRGLTIPLLAGAFGACAAGVIVFLALRSSTVASASLANAPARLEVTPTGPAKIEGATTTTAASTGAVTGTSQPGSVAAGTLAEAKPAPLTTSATKGARDAANAKAHEAAGAAALAASDARREKEKTDALANAAAEVSARSTAATSLAAAPPPAQPEAIAQAAPAAPAKPTILPFGEGMTRPSSISPDEIQFTREAREAKVSGTMIVRCLITTDGSLQNCRIIKSVPMMDQAVLSSLARHRGAPVMYQGHPVSVEYTYTIRLKLAD